MCLLYLGFASLSAGVCCSQNALFRTAILVPPGPDSWTVSIYMNIQKCIIYSIVYFKPFKECKKTYVKQTHSWTKNYELKSKEKAPRMFCLKLILWKICAPSCWYNTFIWSPASKPQVTWKAAKHEFLWHCIHAPTVPFGLHTRHGSFHLKYKMYCGIITARIKKKISTLG